MLRGAVCERVYSNGLDNIVLTDLGPVTGVPEPGTFGLLLLGLAGLAASRHRRQ